MLVYKQITIQIELYIKIKSQIALKKKREKTTNLNNKAGKKNTPDNFI